MKAITHVLSALSFFSFLTASSQTIPNQATLPVTIVEAKENYNTLTNSINQIKAPDTKISVYPNPSVGGTTFEFADIYKNERYEIEIFDNNGKSIHSVNNIKEEKYILYTDKFPPGTYTYKISNGRSAVKSGKLFIN